MYCLHIFVPQKFPSHSNPNIEYFFKFCLCVCVYTHTYIYICEEESISLKAKTFREWFSHRILFQGHHAYNWDYRKRTLISMWSLLFILHLTSGSPASQDSFFSLFINHTAISCCIMCCICFLRSCISLLRAFCYHALPIIQPDRIRHVINSYLLSFSTHHIGSNMHKPYLVATEKENTGYCLVRQVVPNQRLAISPQYSIVNNTLMPLLKSLC